MNIPNILNVGEFPAIFYFNPMPASENFPRWYEEDGFTFHVSLRIPYSACGPDGSLGLFDFLRMTTDCSSEDIRLRGSSMSFLKTQNIARIVARSSFHFYRMPKIDERVEFVTVEGRPDALQFPRNYTLLSEDGQVLVSGTSKWMLTAYDTRKILPTKAILPFRKTNGRVIVAPDCLPCGKIPVPENRQKIGEEVVGNFHLDGNGHMGNSFYAAFIANALPAKWSGRKIIDFRINYSKEALVGEVLELYLSEMAENRVVVVGEKADGISFTGELSF